MSEWAYRFTDFLTGSLLAEVPLPGVTLPDPLGEDGSFTTSVNLRSELAQANGLGGLLVPYRTLVWAVRTHEGAKSIPWAGHLLSSEYESSSGSLDLTVSQIWQWVGEQLIEQDFIFEDVDQFEIVRLVLAYVLGRPNATLPINLGTGNSGIRRTKDWRQRAGKTVAERLEPLMERTNGPLLQFDGEYRTSVDTRFLLRQIISNNPPAPSDRRNLVFDFPNGNVASYRITDDGSEEPVTNAKARVGLIRTVADPKLDDLGNWTLNAAINDGFSKNDLVRFDACDGSPKYYVAEQDMAPRSNRRNRGTWSLANSNSAGDRYLAGDVVLYDDPDTDQECSNYYVAAADIQHDPDLGLGAANPATGTNWNEDDISPRGDSRWDEIAAKDRFIDVVHNIHDRRSNDDLLSDGWPRRTLFAELEDTRDASEVEDATASLMRGKGSLVRSLTMVLAPDADPPYGTYRTGDYVWVQLDDPIGGYLIRRWGQIIQMDTTPRPSGVEEVVVAIDLDL